MFRSFLLRSQKYYFARSTLHGNSTKANLCIRSMATLTNPTRDPNTLSNYNNWICTHSTVNFEIFFEQRKLVGNVIHRLRSATNAETQEVILDSHHVYIGDVQVAGLPVKWELLPPLGPYGTALKIKLENPIKLDEIIDVNISIETTEKCTALQWLTLAQTSNKKHPYMFRADGRWDPVSQCQAIHARSIFPCQDTPDVKSTFDFNITSHLPVIASGLPVRKSSSKPKPGEKSLYQFHQKVPIPSYLFALASGDIVEATVGPRSVVATSPDKLQECQWELEADTERFIDTIEKLIYPYAWGEFNVLILPPSFPYGGMENPVFTFATPSIISKDRENVDVIAHELAHSWSGNLVTSASWEHFWLNEGWTVYLERRILAAIHGEKYRHFSAIIGWKSLRDSVERYGHDHEFTKLVPTLKGNDPDDAFSSIPYEKGFNFLFYLENLIGKDKFDRFIPHYFTTFKEKSLDSDEFKSTLLSFFGPDAEASKILREVDWDAWFYKPGLPPKPDFDTSLANVVYELANKWRSLPEFSFHPQPSDIQGLTANQIVVFLEQVLLFEQPLTADLSKIMGEVYGFAKSENIEVSNLYLQIGLKAGDKSVIEPTVDLLGKIGRMKFVRPLYRTLQKVDRQVAIDTFGKYKDFYHPICRGMVEKDLF